MRPPHVRRAFLKMNISFLRKIVIRPGTKRQNNYVVYNIQGNNYSHYGAALAALDKRMQINIIFYPWQRF